MLPACGGSDKAYAIGYLHAAGQYPERGHTPAEACRNFGSGSGGGLFNSATEHMCTYSAEPGKNFPVIKVCEPPARSPFSMSVDDGAALSMLIIGVWVSAAIFKWLARVVSDKGDKDD